MTRREFFSTATTPALLHAGSTLIVPVHIVIDGRAKLRPEQLDRFWLRLWREAVRDFASCGIQLKGDVSAGEIKRSPGGRPVFTKLARSVINLVITDRIPLQWDNARGLNGVTTRYEGYHLCMIAMSYAHGHEIPLLSVNTCVHELLHALLNDIYEKRPPGFSGQMRELRIDWFATRLWLFHDGATIREAAQTYVEHLRE